MSEHVDNLRLMDEALDGDALISRDKMRLDLRAAADHMERLEAIVDTTFKLADGTPATRGMNAWCNYRGVRGGAVRCVVETETLNFDIEMAYPTPEAAEKHEKGR